MERRQKKEQLKENKKFMEEWIKKEQRDWTKIKQSYNIINQKTLNISKNSYR